MSILKKLFFLLILIFFSSCESVYLDMTNVHCELDKTEYQENEPISISFSGYFEDSKDQGNLRIDFIVYRLIDGKRDEKNISPINLSDYKNPENISTFDDGFYYLYIKNDDAMTEFNDSIIFSISDIGEYELLVNINGSTDKYPYGGSKFFNFPITITQ